MHGWPWMGAGTSGHMAMSSDLDIDYLTLVSSSGFVRTDGPLEGLWALPTFGTGIDQA